MRVRKLVKYVESYVVICCAIFVIQLYRTHLLFSMLMTRNCPEQYIFTNTVGKIKIMKIIGKEL